MKTTLLLIILLTSSLYSKTADFSVIVNQPFNAGLFDITEDYGRTITAVGFSKEFKQNSNNSQPYRSAFDYLSDVSAHYGSQMHLLKIDNNANIILSKQANLEKFNEAIAVVKTPSNGYFVGGYTLDGSLLLVKLDSNANVIFSKVFGTKNYDRMNNLILLSDGGVLAIGSSITSRSTQDNLFETGLGNNDIFITRFTKNGNKLWSKKYGTEFDDRGIDAVEANNGSIIVISTMAQNKKRNVNFMRLTENGNRVWLKEYKQDTQNEDLIIPHKIIKSRDGNFVVSLSKYNENQKEQIKLLKFDLYQNILLDKTISTTYSSRLNDIKEFSDGNFMAVGYVKDTANTDGLAMVFDSNLELLNQEHYGEENYDVFNAVSILHNSQVAVAGMHTDNSSQESNMWITKLNKDASVAQRHMKTSSFYAKLCEVFKDEIKSNHLLIKEDLSIELLDSSLYFKQSKYILNKEQKNFLSQFSKKLIIFLHANQEFVKTLEVNGHTSSEWTTDTDFSAIYLNNAKLSLNRAYSVMSHMFKAQNKEEQKWLTQVLKDSGFSYSKKVMFNEIEDREKSRRVSFRILLKDKSNN